MKWTRGQRGREENVVVSSHTGHPRGPDYSRSSCRRAPPRELTTELARVYDPGGISSVHPHSVRDVTRRKRRVRGISSGCTWWYL